MPSVAPPSATRSERLPVGLLAASGLCYAASPMHRFDRDTALRPLPSPRGESEGEGLRRFAGRIDPGWWIVRGPNGGYVTALVLRGLAAAVDDPERVPRSLTVHFTAPPREGAVELLTRVERVGRSLTSVSGRLEQAGRLLALAVGAFSKARGGPSFDAAVMPDAPAAEPLPSGFSTGGLTLPMHERFDYRWAIGDPPGTSGGRALCGGWIRSREPRLADAALVAAFCDAWPPACFSWAQPVESVGPVPTVDLTVHFRERLPLADAAPDDFYLALFRSRLAREGFVEEDGEVWSRSGHLLAHSRQLAVIG